ncbi:glutamate racemase [Clostridium felsineum]|uniref:Glutamate racemase n=1 Tax=Clostridium felsineum TaxID=36839 RepID=A0A1S8LWX3_9CLOT|nr:glutamate racemase [Clostridium felsineum]MCR3761490.1 glutamate racemase [Clostridium felsineum]URZ03313.1 Glutamate racemase 2 [Clostridium felsineum]URZ08353.1 Glutamate racemase 2 [Clostridium felsineum]URZ13384.1 Glutamate racemase 2 [Clostridium felsineum]
MIVKDNPIGVIDSGVGGISVLREAVKNLPHENFIYYGDSKNAPYGIKSVEEVRSLTCSVVEKLLKMNIKALVVACNTATSAAIDELRERYKNIPIIGIEPALKPAVELKRKGKIIIMATPMTLSESKFRKLMEKYEETSEIVKLPCPGLVELIEDGIVEGPKMQEYLRGKFREYEKDDIAAFVLGCTHYPFVRKEIGKIAHDVPIIDGSEGTVMQLKRKLKKYDILNDNSKGGEVQILNSLISDKIIDLSYKLLKLK